MIKYLGDNMTFAIYFYKLFFVKIDLQVKNLTKTVVLLARLFIQMMHQQFFDEDLE